MQSESKLVEFRRKIDGSIGAMPRKAQYTVILDHLDWDDLFQYETLYAVDIVDPAGSLERLGSIKIGQLGLEGMQRNEFFVKGLPENFRMPRFPASFRRLGNQFFSVGQDISFYQRIAELPDLVKEEILRGLSDVVFDNGLLTRAMGEDVFQVSLLRTVSLQNITGQYRRVIEGGEELAGYNLTFGAGDENSPLQLSFSVSPRSVPPTNVHALIGRNGVGKTTFLSSVVKQVSNELQNSFDRGNSSQVSNVISISFSVFDSVWDMNAGDHAHQEGRASRYHHIGLQVAVRQDELAHPNEGSGSTSASSERLSGSVAKADRSYRFKDHHELGDEIQHSLQQSVTDGRIDRLVSAIVKLENDPVFEGARLSRRLDQFRAAARSVAGADSLSEEVSQNQNPALSASEILRSILDDFGKMSSGHKVVFLSIVRLVELASERTLVLFDEPEGHLHPPLLSAYVRSISSLLSEINGVGIVATHSPVVLQEVPRKCVWVLDRTMNRWLAARPEIETFGENVGILTGEVFGLEVTGTGFHQLLRDIAGTAGTYDAAISQLGGELGAEGRGALRAMFYARYSENA